MLDLDGDMRQIGESGQPPPVMRRLARSCVATETMAPRWPGPEPPEMQVGDLIALAFDHLADLLGHARVRRAVEQDPPVSRSSPTDQLAITSAPMKPASGSIQSQPKVARQHQAGDDQNRDRGIGHDMNDGGAHLVVAVMRAVAVPVIMLLEFHFVLVAWPSRSGEPWRGRRAVPESRRAIADSRLVLEREQLAACRPA